MAISTLVSTGWLAGHLADPGLRVFDTTVHLDPSPRGFEIRSARREYDAAHVPGAGFLDIVAELSDPGSELAFTRPAPEQLGEVLSRHGVGDNPVVLYSSGDVMWATRAWWLLRWVGVRSVSVLDGGLAKWRAEGRAVSSEPCGYEPARFVPHPVAGVWASTEEVERAIGDGGVCTLNALPAPLHTGAVGLGYQRAGRIRGSENVPYSDLLDPSDGTFRPAEVLTERFAKSGALEKARTICYCGGGIAATQNALALLLLDHPEVAVYDGGLNEWSRDPALPMEVGGKPEPASG